MRRFPSWRSTKRYAAGPGAVSPSTNTAGTETGSPPWVPEVRSEPPDWWSADVLSRVWVQLAERLERNGLQAQGRIVVTALDRSERHALGGMLGRVLASDTCRIDLLSLDDRLRARSDEGLVGASERVPVSYTHLRAH